MKNLIKNIAYTLVIGLIIVPNFAQQDTLNFGDVQHVVPNPYSEGTNLDWPNQKGYVAGTNVYRDIGKYQRFEFYSSNYVIGAVLYFGLIDIDSTNTPDTITVVLKSLSNIASDSTEGVYTYGPSDENLASAKITLDQVDTSGVGTLVMFDESIQMSGDDFTPDSFFIGIEWELTDHLDTFTLFSDSTGAELGDGFNRAWEKFEDEKYNDFNCVLSPGYCWGYDIDLWIGAVHSDNFVNVDNFQILFPEKIKLHSAFPNPFNPSTNIKYDLSSDEFISLTIHDLKGRKVKTLVNGFQSAGQHVLEWDSTNEKGQLVTGGVYFYTIQSKTFKKTKKFLLVK